jgi:hypothetical protein
MAQVITIAGERLFALKAQNNEQLDVDTFIFANVLGQDPNATIDRNEGLPPVGQIVHQQIVQQVGRVNDNVVIYSTVLDSLTGPFDFNWVGLYSSVNQTLIAVSHIPSVSKTITVPGAAGNTLNRNFGIEYSGIADLTGITVQPETWQLDFTARLSGMDELTRQLAADMNGKDWFIDDGFKVLPRSTTNTFKVTPGAGYVSGLRVELKQDHILTLQSYPQFVYVDAWFDGDASSQWKPKTAFTVTNGEMDDYIDVNGKQHYVFKLARITAADVVQDLRNTNGLRQELDDHINQSSARQSQIINGLIFPTDTDIGVSVGSVIPASTRFLRIDLGSGLQICEMYPMQSGTVEEINTDWNDLKLTGNNDRTTLRAVGSEWFYKNENAKLMAEWARKLRMVEPVKVVWCGDSNSERGQFATPTAFRGMLQYAYGNTVTSDNTKAVSGRTAEWSFKLANTFIKSDITILALGTNDAIANRFLSGLDEIATYEFFMRKLIEREIQWGNAVALVSPLPMRFDKEWESYSTLAPTDKTNPEIGARPDIAVLRTVLERLSEEYGCPLFDSSEWALRYNDDMFDLQTQSIGGPQTPFGDSIHIKVNYNTAWGYAIAWSLMGDNAITKRTQSAGDTIQFRVGSENIIYNGGKGVFPYSWGGDENIRFASGDTILNERSLIIGDGKRITMPFYVESACIVYPVLYGVSGTTTIVFDQLSPLSQRSVDSEKSRLTKSGLSGNTSSIVTNSKKITSRENQIPCTIYHKGWHSITVDVGGGGSCYFSGLVFDILSDRADLQESLIKINTVPSTTTADCNTLKKSGVYYAGNIANAFWPTGNIALIEVFSNELNTVVVQRATQISGSMYVRTYSDNTWGDVKTFASA